MTKLRYRFYFALFFILLIIFVSFAVIIAIMAEYGKDDIKNTYEAMSVEYINKSMSDYADYVASVVKKDCDNLEEEEREDYLYDFLGEFDKTKYPFSIYVQEVFIHDEENVSVYTLYSSEYRDMNKTSDRYDKKRTLNEKFYPSYDVVEKLCEEETLLSSEEFYSQSDASSGKRNFYCNYNKENNLLITCCFYDGDIQSEAKSYSEKITIGDKNQIIIFLAVMVFIMIVMFVILCYIESLYYKNLERQFLNEKLKSDEKYNKLKKISQTDQLTKCYNRKYINEKMSLAFKDFKTGQLVSSAILFDIDNFKRINDTYGHAAGDEVLKSVADAVRAVIRRDDIFARWGGEEFVVFFKFTYMKPALMIAEKIRAAIEELTVQTPDVQIKVTVSVGVSCFKLVDSSFDECIERADDAMYQSKHTGKNKVTLYDK